MEGSKLVKKPRKAAENADACMGESSSGLGNFTSFSPGLDHTKIRLYVDVAPTPCPESPFDTYSQDKNPDCAPCQSSSFPSPVSTSSSHRFSIDFLVNHPITETTALSPPRFSSMYPLDETLIGKYSSSLDLLSEIALSSHSLQHIPLPLNAHSTPPSSQSITVKNNTLKKESQTNLSEPNDFTISPFYSAPSLIHQYGFDWKSWIR